MHFGGTFDPTLGGSPQLQAHVHLHSGDHLQAGPKLPIPAQLMAMIDDNLIETLSAQNESGKVSGQLGR